MDGDLTRSSRAVAGGPPGRAAARRPRPATLTVRVHLVLEGDARVPDAPSHPDLAVVAAPADGDAAVVALAGELGPGTLVVTADRALRERVGALGARTTGPSALLGLLTP